MGSAKACVTQGRIQINVSATQASPCAGNGSAILRHQWGYTAAALCYGEPFNKQGESEMDQRIINLYDAFTHSRISRREFNEKLTKLAGSAAAAAALLPLLQNDYAKAAIVPENDPALNAQRVSYDSPKGKVNGYLVRLKGAAIK